MMAWRYRRALGVSLFAGACALPPIDADPQAGGESEDTGRLPEDGSESGGDEASRLDVPADVPPEVEPKPPSDMCRPLDPNVSTDPQTIEEAVELINALPKPLSLPCFIESLDRPVAINATDSVFSAQPADGPENPRLFILRGNLVLSIVSGGPGLPLLEFGEFVTDVQTLKGELEFPIETTLTLASAFERLPFGEGVTSVCGFCHGGEYRSDDYAGGFISEAFRPAYWTDVDLALVRAEWENCDPSAEPERCALLEAVFGRGEFEAAEFPSGLPAFFE